MEIRITERRHGQDGGAVNPLAASLLSFAALPVDAQDFPDVVIEQTELVTEGWQSFTDVTFLLSAAATLVLAAGLGALIALHPRHTTTARSVEDTEAPRIYILYAVIGAIIGIMVLKFGLVVGFVLFGIGGLMRFRTVLQSASRTGRVILVTLIGLAAGLNLPHVAVLATIFGFVLICILDRTVTYRVNVQGIPEGRFKESSNAYRVLLEQLKCRVLRERMNPAKSCITYIFRCPSEVAYEQLVDIFEDRIKPDLRGSVNWEID